MMPEAASRYRKEGRWGRPPEKVEGHVRLPLLKRQRTEETAPDKTPFSLHGRKIWGVLYSGRRDTATPPSPLPTLCTPAPPPSYPATAHISPHRLVFFAICVPAAAGRREMRGEDVQIWIAIDLGPQYVFVLPLVMTERGSEWRRRQLPASAVVAGRVAQSADESIRFRYKHLVR